MVQRPSAEFEGYSPFNAIPFWGNSETLSIGTAKVHLTRKARSDCNLGQRQLGLRHQPPGAVKPYVTVVKRGTLLNKSQEEPVQLPL